MAPKQRRGYGGLATVLSRPVPASPRQRPLRLCSPPITPGAAPVGARLTPSIPASFPHSPNLAEEQSNLPSRTKQLFYLCHFTACFSREDSTYRENKELSAKVFPSYPPPPTLTETIFLKCTLTHSTNNDNRVWRVFGREGTGRGSGPRPQIRKGREGRVSAPLPEVLIRAPSDVWVARGGERR